MFHFPKDLKAGLLDRLQDIGTDKWTYENHEPVFLLIEKRADPEPNDEEGTVPRTSTLALTDAGSKWAAPRDMLCVTATVKSSQVEGMPCGSLLKLLQFTINVSQFERSSRLHIQVDELEYVGDWDGVKSARFLVKSHPVTYPVQVQLPAFDKKKKRGPLC
eukprot:GHVU01216415.1.p1 GENE.GHVU01216415.1~~GHVU01216415.1.p1  ORF type:complete len:161 (+),score=12.42 GHVU01216415.1:36-518(+)